MIRGRPWNLTTKGYAAQVYIFFHFSVVPRICNQREVCFYYSRIKKGESQGKNVTLETMMHSKPGSFEHNAHHVPLRQTVGFRV